MDARMIGIENMINGVVLAVENMGGKFVKFDEEFVYIEIKAGSDLTEHAKQIRLTEFLKKTFNIGLRIRMIP
jgi:hypothetical protein